LLDCASDTDCFYFPDDVCVNVAGLGKCARLAPHPDDSASGCQEPSPRAVQLPRLVGGQTVVVCANTSQRCEQGQCVPTCETDAACTPAKNGSICDEGGACRCVKDDDCGGPGVSRCNVATGSCECTRDTDCNDLLGADVCVNGRCGCSSVTVCSGQALFDATTLTCE
jgi:hypothetical protein